MPLLVLLELAFGGAQRIAAMDKRAKQIMEMARILPVRWTQNMQTLAHCHKPSSMSPASLVRVRVRLATAALLLAFMHAATATEPATVVTARESADAAVACARAATVRQRINLSSGVYTERAIASAPLAFEFDTGLDQAQYGECLRREGFDERAATTAYLDRAADCRARHTPPVRLARQDGHARLAGALDEPAYRACLEGALEVEVTLPE